VNLKQNYFELFDLPVCTRVNLADLSERYRKLQHQMHPDRFAAATEHEQRLSLQYTTLVNEAYEVLSSTLKRAMYLLELRGIELSETENTEVEPLFLMQQIELRERLEEVSEAADPIEELGQLKVKVNTIIDELSDEFNQHWQEDTKASAELAITTVRKMQYLTKLNQEIDLREEEILDY
jgi:molecular chaperone HscB